MDKYLRERDDYRVADGKPRKWEGANLRLTHKMMGKIKVYQTWLRYKELL